MDRTPTDERGARSEGRRRSTVLVVDDDAEMRLVLQRLLREHWRVILAGSGEEALRVVAEESVDLVILDQHMPGLSGIETCGLLKERAGRLFLPVILLTVSKDAETRYRALQAGADDFLAKPVDARELQLRLDNFARLRDREAVVRGELERLEGLHTLQGELAGLVHHDLLNSLSGVLLLISTMSDGDGVSGAHLGLLSRNAHAMHEVLEDLVRIGQLEEGRLEVERDDVDAAALLAGAVSLAAAAARSSRCVVRCESAPGLQVYGDPRLLQRVLFNLLQNAIKHSPPGAEVLVRAEAVDGGARLEVLDAGAGFGGGDTSGLFGKYAGLQTSRERGRKGFGLGLYFVHLVVEAHGGTATASDRPEGGAAFRVRIPGRR